MNIDKIQILDFLYTIKTEFKHQGIEKIALFGSFVHNKNNVYSDIDIAIKKNRNYFKTNGAYSYFYTLNSLKNKLRNHFKREIDIFDLDSQSPFKQNIENELIYV